MNSEYPITLTGLLAAELDRQKAIIQKFRDGITNPNNHVTPVVLGKLGPALQAEQMVRDLAALYASNRPDPVEALTLAIAQVTRRLLTEQLSAANSMVFALAFAAEHDALVALIEFYTWCIEALQAS